MNWFLKTDEMGVTNLKYTVCLTLTTLALAGFLWAILWVVFSEKEVEINDIIPRREQAV